MPFGQLFVQLRGCLESLAGFPCCSPALRPGVFMQVSCRFKVAREFAQDFLRKLREPLSSALFHLGVSLTLSSEGGSPDSPLCLS